MAKIRRMFPGGNTSEGFYSFHEYILKNKKGKMYILKGVPGGGKSSLIKSVAEKMLDKGYTLEFHHCPSDKNSVDGIVIKELETAIVDGTSPHIIEPVYPGLSEKIINLGKFIQEEKLQAFRDEIILVRKNNKDCYRRTYAYFRSAKEIRKEIKDANRQDINMIKIYKEIERLENKLFKNIEPSDRLGTARHLFSAAYTPEGYVDFIDTLLAGQDEIYYISGEMGMGEEKILNSILDTTIKKGFDLEVYHDPLVAREIESLIIPKLKIVISSNPACKNKSTEIIDLNPNINDNKINRKDYRVFEELISIGLKSLEKAKENYKLLEKYYHPAVNYKRIDEVKENIISEILS